MKRSKLKRMIFLALCCDMGLFSKKLIAPAANVITEALHVPGGIATAFSLMFLVVAAMLAPGFGTAAAMGAVQSVIAFSFGMVGSMGALAPVGYIAPGLCIDCVTWFAKQLKLSGELAMLMSNMLASACACLTANLIVFHLSGLVLLLYLALSMTSGACCGLLANALVKRLAAYTGMKETGEAHA